MAQNHIIVLAGCIFAGSEHSAQLRAYAQDGKQFCGNHGARQPDGFVLTSQIEFMAFGVSGNVHRADLLAHGHESTPRIGAVHIRQLFRLRVREWCEQDSVHETKNRGIRANTEPER